MVDTSQLSLDVRYVKDESVVARIVGQEVLLVPTHNNVTEMDHIFVLNAVAARIWQLLDGEHTLAEICAMICDEFEVTSTEAEQDTVEFLSKLLSADIARRV